MCRLHCATGAFYTESAPFFGQVPVSMATFMGSLSSAAWRIIITPAPWRPICLGPRGDLIGMGLVYFGGGELGIILY